jgi:putative ABC transport system permease protein
MHLLQLMWKNAVRNRRRTTLTILSIAVSMFLVSTLHALLVAMYQPGQTTGSARSIVIVHRATSLAQPLPVALRQRIESVPGVKAAVGVNWFGGQYIDASNFFANYAVQTDEFEKVFDEYQVLPDQLAAWKRERTAALVGAKLMETYHWKIGERITLQGTIYPFSPELVIRAVYRDPADEGQESSLYFHHKYLDESLGGAGQVGNFTVRVDSPQDVAGVSEAIDAMFRNTANETKTETVQAFMLSFVSMLGNVKLLLSAISAAVVFTILPVTGNTMTMSIRERTSEVAVLKTLGFRRNTVLRLLVGESMVTALLGGLLGTLGAKLAYAYIHATYDYGRISGLAFACAVAGVSGYGTWMLLAGSGGRGRLKVVRYAATLVGALIGLAVAFVFYTAVGFVTNQTGFMTDFSVPLVTVGLCLGIAAAVGLVSASFPALRASRIGIAEALRSVV